MRICRAQALGKAHIFLGHVSYQYFCSRELCRCQIRRQIDVRNSRILEDPRDYVVRDGQLVNVYLVNLVP